MAEFAFLGVLGVIALRFAWGGPRPAQITVQRVRTLLTILLLGLFIFAGVVDLFNGAWGWDFEVIEEVGERAIVTLTTAYSIGLASIKEWWLLP